MLRSHHSHSGQFCKHADGQLEDVVLEAIRQNFKSYGLTEHVPRYRTIDLYPEEAELSPEVLVEQFDAFVNEAHRLKTKYASKITLLIGLETEFITDADLNGLETLLERHGERIEFIVGSVHHVNGVPIDFDIATFQSCLRSFGGETEEYSQGAFLCAYFDAQYTLLHRFHPEVIGHFDLCRLYNSQLRIADYDLALQKMMRNVLYAIEYGALFELNSAAFRKGWDTAYPGRDVVQLILEHNGRFALSDDSHGPNMVGQNYDRLIAYIQEVQLSDLWYLQKSDMPNKAGRRVCSAKVSLHHKDSGGCL